MLIISQNYFQMACWTQISRKERKKMFQKVLYFTYYQHANALTLKALNKFAADNILVFVFFFNYFSVKIKLDISCESAASRWFTWNVKSSFSLKNENKQTIECRLLQLWLAL